MSKRMLVDPRASALFAALAAATSVGCAGPPPAPAESPAGESAQDQGGLEVTVDDFTAPLSNYGTWSDDPTYGRVWQPSPDVAGPDFVPYASDGSWVTNEDGAWMFQSKYDTEWGWATYHYGRWIVRADGRWAWVPDAVWGPSWVDWRYGEGVVGWVPLGPAGYAVLEDRWFFVGEQHLGDPVLLAFRFRGERAHAAFLHAERLGGRGPSANRIRAAGGSVRTARYARPTRAAVRASARSSVMRAMSNGRASPGSLSRYGLHGGGAHADAVAAVRASGPAGRASRPEAHAAPAAHASAPAERAERSAPPEHASPQPPATSHSAPQHAHAHNANQTHNTPAAHTAAHNTPHPAAHSAPAAHAAAPVVKPKPKTPPPPATPVKHHK